MVTRYLYTVKAPYNELDKYDERVNEIVGILKEKNAKVVSFLQSQFGISPMYLVCSIVYESEIDLKPEIKVILGDKPKSTKKRKGAGADD